jgi:retinol dehydrogenase-12
METSSVIILSVVIPVAFIIFLILLRICYINGPKNKQSSNVAGKIIIITGASSGIGKLAAFDLLEKGAIVIFGCRSEEKTLALIQTAKTNKQNAHFLQLDLGDINSIRLFAEQFKQKFGKCDILVNNAGAWNTHYSETNRIETTFMCNHVGPVILTTLLLECMSENSRIINLSSMMASYTKPKTIDKLCADEINEMSNDAMENYCLSKLANIYHAKFLENHFHLKDLRIKACSLHPGAVNTEFSNGFQSSCSKFICCLFYPFVWYFFKTPWMGTQTTLHCVNLEYEKLTSGAYYSDCSEAKLNGLSCDGEKMREVMNYTKKVINTNLNNVPEIVCEFLNSS